MSPISRNFHFALRPLLCCKVSFSYRHNYSRTHSHIIMTIRRDFVLLYFYYIIIMTFFVPCTSQYKSTTNNLPQDIYICRFAACSGIDIFFRFSLCTRLECVFLNSHPNQTHKRKFFSSPSIYLSPSRGKWVKSQYRK